MVDPSIAAEIIDTIVSRFRRLPGVEYVGKDLHPVEEHKEGFPALFVNRGSGGQVQSLPSERIREIIVLIIWGYVVAPVGEIDGITEAREAFYKRMLDSLLSREMHDAIALVIDNKKGWSWLGLVHTAGPDTDEGETPPWGIFRLQVGVIVHYQRGTF